MPNIYITSCPRSGTHYTANLLNRCGLKIGHELLDTDGIVSWYNRKVINESDFIFLHQVRHPIDTISSISYITSESFTEAHRTITFPGSRNKIEHAMYFWYYWNRYIQKDCIFTYKLEEIEDLFDILDLFKIQYNTVDIRNLPILNVTENKKNITIDDLYRINYNMTRKIIKLGKIYGYQICE